MILLAARLTLATVFAVAAVGKLRDRAGTARSLRDFGVQARWAVPAGLALPICELAVSGLLVPNLTARAGATGGLVLLGVFGLAITRSIARGEQPDCNCFGSVHSAPAGWQTLARNVVFGGVAVAVVSAGPGRSVTSAFDGVEPWVAVIALVLATQLVFSWQLFRQNGRLIVRLRALERRFEPGQDAAGSRHGLDPGELAPTFELPDLEGRPIVLDGLLARGRTVALVFSDPGCGACTALLPALARAERERTDLTVALVSTGDVVHNRMRLDGSGVATVLLQDDHEVFKAYAVKAMPASVLIDVDGRIASPLAVGAPRVEELLLGPRLAAAELLDVVSQATSW